MKVNILQLIGSFHQGGSERQAVQLTKLLFGDQTFKVFLATLNNEGVLQKEINEIGLNINEFKLSSFYDSNMFQQMRKFKQFVRANNIKLIHTHDFYTNVFGMFAGTFANVPVRIASKRETGGMKTSKQLFLERQAFRFAHKITANAQAVRDYLLEEGIPSNKIEVFYNGLDIKRLSVNSNLSKKDIAQKSGLPGNENLRFITIVANLHHEVKNHRMFLRTAKRVAEEYQNAHFVIAGEGSLTSEMKEIANQLEIAEKCHFIGRCQNIPELLSISDICVLTSTNEGFSNSILEYMSAGKPVIATNVGGASEAIEDGKTGYLVESNDDTAMAQKLLDLLNDSQKSNNMGKLGRLKIEQDFSTSAQLEKILTLYQTQLTSKIK